MAFTFTSLPLSFYTLFPDVVVDLNKNIGGSTDLAKIKRHGSAGLAYPYSSRSFIKPGICAVRLTLIDWQWKASTIVANHDSHGKLLLQMLAPLSLSFFVGESVLTTVSAGG